MTSDDPRRADTTNTHDPADTSTPTGGLPYGLGFLAYIPVPFVNMLITGIVMVAVYPSQKKRGHLAAENARYAANWGLTLIATLAAILALYFITIAVGPEDSSVAAWLVAPLVLFFGSGIAHLVVIITGLVKANKRTVFRNRLAIPFLR